MKYFENDKKEDKKKDKRPRVPEDLFEEVQEDEDKPFHENLQEKLGVDQDDDDKGGGLL